MRLSTLNHVTSEASDNEVVYWHRLGDRTDFFDRNFGHCVGRVGYISSFSLDATLRMS